MTLTKDKCSLLVAMMNCNKSCIRRPWMSKPILSVSVSARQAARCTAVATGHNTTVQVSSESTHHGLISDNRQAICLDESTLFGLSVASASSDLHQKCQPGTLKSSTVPLAARALRAQGGPLKHQRTVYSYEYGVEVLTRTVLDCR
eukprot:scaffold174425_cov43-Prasinocladus_malaysianus.AAC.1